MNVVMATIVEQLLKDGKHHFIERLVCSFVTKIKYAGDCISIFRAY
jgi:hypothetical protein